jgi:hypothetical protein
MSNIIEEDNFIESDDEMTYYKILNVVDDGELRTDWQVVNMARRTIEEGYYRCQFTPWLFYGDLPWQILFWINKQYFHISVLRRNEPNGCPNEGVQIKFDTYFSGKNQLSTKLDSDDSILNYVQGYYVQTISECFIKETSSRDHTAYKHYELELNDQWMSITIMYCGDVAKIDFYSSFKRNKNQMTLSYTIHNGEADCEETAMRYDPEWREAVDPNPNPNDSFHNKRHI